LFIRSRRASLLVWELGFFGSTASAHCKSFLVFGKAFKPVLVLLLAYGAMVQNAVVE
jgi:hypothetical protein